MIFVSSGASFRVIGNMEMEQVLILASRFFQAALQRIRRVRRGLRLGRFRLSIIFCVRLISCVAILVGSTSAAFSGTLPGLHPACPHPATAGRDARARSPARKRSRS